MPPDTKKWLDGSMLSRLLTMDQRNALNLTLFFSNLQRKTPLFHTAGSERATGTAEEITM